MLDGILSIAEQPIRKKSSIRFIVKYTNTGDEPWIADGENPIRLRPKVLKKISGEEVGLDPPGFSGINFYRDILPGDTGYLNIGMDMRGKFYRDLPKGEYFFKVGLVKEMVKWFGLCALVRVEL